MICRNALFACLILIGGLTNAQTTMNAAEIVAGFNQLKIKGAALYIAAHPDDENTRLLSYLAKEAKVKTGYLSLTRGDGGQNLIGNEQAELLGLIRTQELLAARKVDGAEQFFTRANDFGYSKTPEESFKIWNKEQILADVVWVIRKFKPDVIITRFPEDSRAGHGHHSGSGILAKEAFSAAADPKRFPEQLQFVQPWQAKRLVWNTYNFGNNNTTDPKQLKIDVGLYNPLLGKSYGEIAAISRTNHKSQGFGSALQRGEAFEYFNHIAGEPAKNSLFDGIDININEKEVNLLLNSIQEQYQAKAPWLSIAKLLSLKKLTQNNASFKHQLLDQLIMACAGVWVESNATENVYAAGDSIPVKISAIYRSNNQFPITISVGLPNQSSIKLEENKLATTDYKLATQQNDSTQPYWLKANHPIGQYEITNQQEVGFPENPNSIAVPISLLINGETIKINSPVNFKFTHPIKGEKYQPIVLAPAVTATLSEKAYIFIGNNAKTINVALKSFANNSEGFVQPQLPKGWKSNPEKINFNLLKKGDEQTVSFTITPSTEQNNGTLNLQVYANGNTSDKGLKSINYDHIPHLTIFPKAIARLEKIDLKIAGKRIAYIDGAGDLVADALKQIGYEVTNLSTAQIANTDLQNFDAIVTGVRLYNINEDVKTIQPKLLAYVNNGGTLLIQYNVNNGLKTQNIGPYPFKISNTRVTEEDAKVIFSAPAHPALNYPNKITEKDFEGWVQERGLYFATAIDPKYQTILSMADTNEQPSEGALLVANYGKGKFIYTSLVFFRELPAGVPGAFKLFVNLLAPNP